MWAVQLATESGGIINIIFAKGNNIVIDLGVAASHRVTPWGITRPSYIHFDSTFVKSRIKVESVGGSTLCGLCN